MPAIFYLCITQIDSSGFHVTIRGSSLAREGVMRPGAKVYTHPAVGEMHDECARLRALLGKLTSLEGPAGQRVKTELQFAEADVAALRRMIQTDTTEGMAGFISDKRLSQEEFGLFHSVVSSGS